MKSRPDLRETIATNMKFFMARQNAPYRNANSLGGAAGVSPNTVRNLLDPRKRTVTAEKPEGYPTLDKLQDIANKLPCEVWQLLHPNIAKAIREQEMYRLVEETFAKLPAIEEKKPAKMQKVPLGGF